MSSSFATSAVGRLSVVLTPLALAYLVVRAPVVTVGAGVMACLAVSAYVRRSGPLLAAALATMLVSGFVESHGVSASSWSGLVGALAIASFAVGVLARRTGGGARVGLSIQGALLGGFLALAAGYSLLAAVSGDGSRSLLGLRVWCFFGILYWVGRWIVDDPRALRVALGGTAVALGATFAYGFKQFLYGYTPAELALVNADKHSIFYDGVPRLAATLPTNQDFAAMLVVALPSIVAFAVVGHERRTRRAMLVALGIAAATLAVLGMVRSAAIAAAVGAVLVLVLVSRERRRAILVGLLALIVTGSVVQITLAQTTSQGDAVRARLLSLTKLTQDPALSARLNVVWPQTIHAIENKPWGHGVATTGGPAIKLDGPAAAVIPDNGYLTIAYELGILGAVIFASFLVSVAVAARRALAFGALKPTERALVLAAIGTVASVLIAMLGGSFVQLPTFQMLLMPLLGAATRISERQ